MRCAIFTHFSSITNVCDASSADEPAVDDRAEDAAQDVVPTVSSVLLTALTGAATSRFKTHTDLGYSQRTKVAIKDSGEMEFCGPVKDGSWATSDASQVCLGASISGGRWLTPSLVGVRTNETDENALTAESESAPAYSSCKVTPRFWIIQTTSGWIYGIIKPRDCCLKNWDDQLIAMVYMNVGASCRWSESISGSMHLKTNSNFEKRRKQGKIKPRSIMSWRIVALHQRWSSSSTALHHGYKSVVAITKCRWNTKAMKEMVEKDSHLLKAYSGWLQHPSRILVRTQRTK